MAIVKKPKWKRATGSEGAISVKGGAYPVRGTGVGGGKVRGEVSAKNAHIKRLQLQKAKQMAAIKARNEKIAKLKADVRNVNTKIDKLANKIQKRGFKAGQKDGILMESMRKPIIDMKNVVKAKSPSKIVHSAKVAAIGAGLVAAGYAIPKKKKSPVVIKKKSPVAKKKKNLRIDIIGKSSRYTTLKRNR